LQEHEVVREVLGIELVEIPTELLRGIVGAQHGLHPVSGVAGADLAQAQQVGLADLAIPARRATRGWRAADLALRRTGRSGRQMRRRWVHLRGRVRPRTCWTCGQTIRRRRADGEGEQAAEGAEAGVLLRLPVDTAAGVHRAVDDPEHPQTMDRVLGLLGAEPVAWSYGVDCCGGSLTLNRSDVAVHLVDKLVAAAHEAGADAMVTACPMCMANVDGRQLFRGGSPIRANRGPTTSRCRSFISPS